MSQAIIKLPQKQPGGSSVTVDSEMSATSTNPVQNKVISAAMDEKIDNYVDATVTLATATWTGTSVPYIYDLSTDYPTASCDITVSIDSSAASTTAATIGAFTDALIYGSTDNKLYAWGEKPTVDIPVLVRKWVK